MSTQVFDVDYFIKKFEAIPDYEWTVGTVAKRDGACCVLGHCGVAVTAERKWVRTPESNALDDLFWSFFNFGTDAEKATISYFINDKLDPRYNQNGAKARILAALNDIKQGKVTQ